MHFDLPSFFGAVLFVIFDISLLSNYTHKNAVLTEHFVVWRPPRHLFNSACRTGGCGYGSSFISKPHSEWPASQGLRPSPAHHSPEENDGALESFYEYTRTISESEHLVHNLLPNPDERDFSP